MSGPKRPGRRSEFDGRSNSSDDHDHTNDHFALVYEDRNEQFAAVIPFIREGLDRGERCLYVADDNSREEVLSRMDDHGIDVDAALESGSLSVLTPAETYRRTGEFDREAMVAFWEETLEEATGEGGHAGVRAAAEMTWALDRETTADDLVEYEATLNPLYRNDEYAVMCQYNRERFPAEVIHDVIETHPHVVADGTVSENFYYTPPETYFDDEKMETTVERMMGTLQERTEMKAVLNERRAYLERIFESSHDGIVVVDPDAGRIVDANSTATDLFGYSHDELLALDPADVFCGQRDALDDFLEEVLADGDGRIDELACHTAERGRIPADVSASRMELDGRPVVLAVVRDVSERRTWERAQRRLYGLTADPDRTFEEKLQAMFDLGSEQFDLDLGGIARIDPATNLFEVEHLSDSHEHLEPGVRVELSETYCRVHEGCDETTGIVNPADEGFEETKAYDEFGVNAYLGTRLDVDDGPDRTFFFVGSEPRQSAFSDAERTFLRLMGQWVTYELERTERERELERALDLLERTERIADVGGWEIDPGTTDVFWTDHIFELLEVPGDEEPPLEEALDMYHEADQGLVEGALEDALDSGEPFDVEARVRTAGDEVRWLRLQGVPEAVDGEVVSLRGAAQDVTEHKRRERRLEEVVERLETSNERLEQFAHAASHDLQEPLRMVSSYLRLLEHRYGSALDEEGEEFLEFAVDGADRMREMIQGLLEYSRVETQGDPLEPVNLDEAFDDVLSDLQLQIEEHDAEITAEELPRVRGDASQLRQVFQNLLENAITYSGDERPRISVSAERDGGEWILSVRDEGIGVDADDQERIFEVFQRLHAQGEYDGTGIGLALCERIVERHGGEIRLESERGEGTTVSFTLQAVRTDER